MKILFLATLHSIWYSCSPDQGWNLCPLHWKCESQALDHQGSPKTKILNWEVCLVKEKPESAILFWICYCLPTWFWTYFFLSLTSVSVLVSVKWGAWTRTVLLKIFPLRCFLWTPCFYLLNKLHLLRNYLFMFLCVLLIQGVRVSKHFWIAGERYLLQAKLINKFKLKEFYYPACTAQLKQINKLYRNPHRPSLLFSDSPGWMEWDPINHFPQPRPTPSSDFILSRLLPQ